jgi:Ca-activated chloride channel homolog
MQTRRHIMSRPITEEKIERSALFMSLLLILFVSLFAAAAANAHVTCRVETDRSVLPATGSHKVVVKVTLDAAKGPDKSKRPPVNLAIVLDRSGSMAGEKLQKAKEAAIEALRRLSPQDTFSLVVYDHTVETVVPAQKVRDVEDIAERIRGIRPGGRTALFAGLSQGASEIRKNLRRSYIHRIILLSDGLANVGPSSAADLGRLGAALLKEDISVTTVGVGLDYNEDLMTNLSRQSDGNTYFVETSRDLPRIFSAELGDVLNVVAKNVKVIIECPRGIRPLGIVGRDGRIKGQNVEIFLNQLYGEQKKYVFLEVETSGARSGAEMQIAAAKVSYENPLDGHVRDTSSQAMARFSDNEAEVGQSLNVRVQEDFALNQSALSQERAITLADEGKSKEAVRELNRSADELRNLGNVHSNEEMLRRANEIQQQATQIEKQGMTPGDRKALRTDSIQRQNQQLNR